MEEWYLKIDDFDENTFQKTPQKNVRKELHSEPSRLG